MNRLAPTEAELRLRRSLPRWHPVIRAGATRLQRSKSLQRPLASPLLATNEPPAEAGLLITSTTLSLGAAPTANPVRKTTEQETVTTIGRNDEEMAEAPSGWLHPGGVSFSLSRPTPLSQNEVFILLVFLRLSDPIQPALNPSNPLENEI